jgi:hypothetical protein
MATSPFLAYAGGGDKPTAMGDAMPKHRERDEFDIVLYVILGLVGIAVVMGLIEWNARRQAAAITREMLRPATAEETRTLNRLTREAELEAEQAVRAIYKPYPYPPPNRSRKPVRDLTPLAQDERCISGQRFRRLNNGWEEIGSC